MLYTIMVTLSNIQMSVFSDIQNQYQTWNFKTKISEQ